MIIAWVISLGLVFVFGYMYRSLVNKVKDLGEYIRPEPIIETQSELLDPDDPATAVRLAKQEREERMKSLNPGDYDL